MESVNYQKLGLKCGLEIHQQLNTERKLFCRCPANYRNDKPHIEILRHMRPTLSELGEYDGTALMEFKTKKQVTYQIYNDSVCTYEIDDTPPFEVNPKALDIALEIALLLNCSIIDEVHVSRKQYLDGSIPTGFQRTMIVGINGWIPYKNRKIGIIQLALEEDACREVSDNAHNIIFKTDRLSIPLVEVVTEADMHTPKEAREVAEILGRFMRGTNKVRRGLGSVRQDVNVSIIGGKRVEIKGVPKLQWIEKLVHYEAIRQYSLLEIQKDLKKRSVSKDNLKIEHKELNQTLKDTKCEIFNKILQNNDRIIGVKLPNFSGLLRKKTHKNLDFAREFAGRIKVIACLDSNPNFFYSDEIPNYCITKKDLNIIKKELNTKKKDEIIIIWGNEVDVNTAINEIKIRAVEALDGVLNETRQAFENGTTGFERILPGPNRMYPDTDEPPITITKKRLNKIISQMGDSVWEREKRYEKLKIPNCIGRTLAISKRVELFDKIVNELDQKPILVAVILLQNLKEMRRKGFNVSNISDDKIYSIFNALKNKKISKEAIPIILEFLAINPNKTLIEAIHELGFKPVKNLEEIIKEIVMNNNQKNNSFCRMMGEVMKTLRGNADGQEISEVVNKILNKNF